jgi:hypothetical protein
VNEGPLAPQGIDKNLARIMHGDEIFAATVA